MSWQTQAYIAALVMISSVALALTLWARQRRVTPGGLVAARDLLSENLGNGALVLDAQNHIADISPAAQQLIGLNAAHIGQPAEVVLATWPDLVARLRETRPAQVEIQVGQAAPRDLELRLSPLHDRRGRFTGQLIVLRDITGQKQVEEKLRQLSRAVEQSPDTVVITDPPGNIVYVNPKFTQLTGYSAEEVLGQNPRILKSGQTPPEEYQRMWQAITSGGEWHGEFLNKKKNGELYWESAVISPITDAQGHITHFLAVKEEITERKRLEQVEREQRALTEAMRDTAAALNSTLDLDQVLDRILTNVGRVVPHDAANIMLVDAATGLAHVARAQGYRHVAPGLEQEILSLRLPVHQVPNLLRMAEDGQPIVVSEVQQSPDWIPLGTTGWLGSYVAAPIRMKGQAIGFLNLNSATPGFYHETHAERLRAFADQAAIAIENARLFKEAQQRNQRLALINEISVAINQPVELNAVLQAAVDGLTRVLNVSQIGVALFDQTRQHLTVVADHPAPGNSSAVGIELPIEGNLSLQHILTTKAPLMIQDVQSDPITVGLREVMARQRVCSILLVPLIVRDQVIGTIGCDAIQAPRQFTPEEIELAQTIANLVALRIEQARLFEAEHTARQQVQRHATDLSGLYAITRATSRSLALEDVLAQALSSAIVSLRFEAGTIALTEMDGSSSSLRLVASRGLPPALLQQLGAGGLDGTLSAYVHAQREIVLIDDLEQETSAARRGMVEVYGTPGWRAYVGIPLLQQEQSLGAMCLFARQPRPASSYDMALLASIGHQIATAITNAQLFQTTISERSRLKALIESSRDGIILTTIDGRIVVVNAQALQMLRLPGQPEDWLGIKMRAVANQLRDHTPEGYQAAMTEIERIQAGDEPPAEGEVEVTSRVLYWQTLPVRVGTRPMGRLLVLRDMTDERAVERMRQDMTHTMVHDLRNPLSAISTSLGFLTSGMMGEIPPDQRPFLDIASRNARRMLDLVNAILDVSRLESGRMPLEPTAFSIADLMLEVVQSQTALADEKGLGLESGAPPTLLPAWGDVKLLQRVLQNLIGNAIKFTPAGGLVRAMARMDEQAGRPILLVSVSDTGPGIPPEISSRLFQKFVTGSQEGSGSGLGLAFCRLAIEAHGQRIWVESAPGEGATFTFSLATAMMPQLA